MYNFLTEVFTSPVFTTILTLLLLFQWLWNRAKERSVVNGILATRRMIRRMAESEWNSVAADALDSIDAVLASLGSRLPFSNWATTHLRDAAKSFEAEESAPLVERTSAK